MAEIPELTMGALRRWVDHGIWPGSFLTSVLQDNLFQSVHRADEENRAALGALVVYIFNNVPVACWGSEESMLEWQAYRQNQKRS